MASLFDELPERIARLEAKYGAEHPYVLELKAQLAAGRSPSETQRYTFQAVRRLAPDPAEEVMAWADAQRAAQVVPKDDS